MESSRKKITHVLASSLLLIAIPLVIFPKLFGFQPLQVSWQYFFYEFVFYGLAAVALFGARSLMTTVRTALTAFGYRLLLSSIFGLVISTVYSMDFQVSMQLALISYLPGVACQIVLTPFACWPLLKISGFTPRRPRETKWRETAAEPSHTVPYAPFPVASGRDRTVHSDSTAPRNDSLQSEALLMHARPKPDASPVTVTGDLNGFERTVRYIAEHGSVLYAAVVDPEGLLLANHTRGRVEPEDLAPLAVMFFELNRTVLDKGKLGPAEKIDITLRDKRLILGRVDDWCLMVLSERQADDLLNIRINQGMDILRKFTAERYTPGREARVENAHV